MRRHLGRCAGVLGAAVCLLAFAAHGDTLTIKSTPEGATVEINGARVGVTPCQLNFPGGYFHKPHSVFSARLERAMIMRISMRGFVTRQITMTDGPLEWRGFNGKPHGNYWLLKMPVFEVTLESADPLGETSLEDNVDPAGPIAPRHAAEAESLRTTTSAENDTGSVEIGSDPPGADIYVDGKFVGETPSTLQLAAGTHHLELKAAGRKSWERDLEVLKGSLLTLHPALDSQPR
ncbi:MAG: PEGA domain-containing protein [Candidatus Acidiferrales bacterium]